MFIFHRSLWIETARTVAYSQNRFAKELFGINGDGGTISRSVASEVTRILAESLVKSRLATRFTCRRRCEDHHISRDAGNLEEGVEIARRYRPRELRVEL